MVVESCVTRVAVVHSVYPASVATCQAIEDLFEGYDVTKHRLACETPQVCINNDEFCIQNDDSCIKDDDL